MLIQLPVETWIEILDWLRRRDLIKKLDSLWDREFTPIVQDWLHKYTRNVELAWLRADKRNGLSVRVCLSKGFVRSERVPFADAELPENVTSFGRITINYLDSNALTLLRRMRPLFHNVCLLLDFEQISCMMEYKDESLSRTHLALPLLMPMISNGSIESLVMECKFLQFFSVNHPTALLNAKLLGICSYANQEVTSGMLISWLFTPRQDGQPRTLLLFSCCDDFSVFWEKLRERFLDPARQTARPFFIRIPNYIPNLPPNGSVIENVPTGEQLTVSAGPCEESSTLISNCALNNVGDQQELTDEKAAEVVNWDVDNLRLQRVIWLDYLEIGPLCAEDDASINQQQQASGSGMKLN